MFAGPGFAQAWLNVLNPQRNWQTDQGQIEEAVVSIRPHGIYTEVGLYLTFSDRGTRFSEGEQLEVVYHFELPSGSAVVDSWLWIEDEIIRADIRDVWTASAIYEDIVDRRRDPSLLTKVGRDQYELRVFPLIGGQTRKVKITCLVPTQWFSESVAVALPTQILQVSRSPIEVIRVLTWPDETWRSPRIENRDDLSFRAVNDEDLGTFAELRLAQADLGQPLSLAFANPMRDGLFVSHTQTPEEGWYQLALLPDQLVDADRAKRVAVMLDYDAAKTDLSQQHVLDGVRRWLKMTLGPSDRFNLILSRLPVQRLSTTWISGDDVSIDATFSELGSTPLAGYSNLPAVLAEGIAFVEAQADPGELLLISSSDQVGQVEATEALLDDLKAVSNPLPPIHVVDVTTQDFPVHRIGGLSYPGNAYFYTNLTHSSGGTFATTRDEPDLDRALARTFAALNGTIKAFDLYTSLTDGFTFGRFSSHEGNETAPVAEAIVQVGRYVGSGNVEVEASGVFQDTPFSRKWIVSSTEARESDSTLAQHWTARQIAELEQRPATNDIIAQIIAYSLEQRVLTSYTAFLALEPQQGGEVCATCEDESDGETVDIEDDLPQAGVEAFEAYPNPFVEQVTLHLSFAEPVEVGTLALEIYDAMGQLIRVLALSGSGLVHELDVTWDGTNALGEPVASGTYFAVLTTPNGRKAISLIRI